MEHNNTGEYQEIYSDKINEPPNAMRSSIDELELSELSQNIKINGLINPITVRPLGDRFEIVAGHRRFLACVMARMIKIPCIVKVMNDDEVFSVMASENLARQDTNPVDEAEFVVKIKRARNTDIDGIAAIVKRTRAWVEDRLTVGEMSDYMKEYLRKKQISLGVALLLAKIEHDPLRRSWCDEAVRCGVSIPTARLWLQQYESQKLPDGSLPTEFAQPSDDGNTQIYRTRCALDDQLYPPSEMKSVMVWKGNWGIIEAVRAELRAESAPPPNAAAQQDAATG
jgi:ParB/RepB/Spo0J family partition protein